MSTQLYRIHFQNPVKWREDVDCIIRPLEEKRQLKTFIRDSEEKGYLILRLKKGSTDLTKLESFEKYNQHSQKWETLFVTKLNQIYYLDYIHKIERRKKNV